MAYGDDLEAVDPQGVLTGLIAEQAPELVQNNTVDPQAVLNRLIRKGLDRRQQQQLRSQTPEQPSPDTGGVDFSSYGEPVDTNAQGTDFSSYGEPVNPPRGIGSDAARTPDVEQPEWSGQENRARVRAEQKAKEQEPTPLSPEQIDTINATPAQQPQPADLGGYGVPGMDAVQPPPEAAAAPGTPPATARTMSPAELEQQKKDLAATKMPAWEVAWKAAERASMEAYGNIASAFTGWKKEKNAQQPDYVDTLMQKSMLKDGGWKDADWWTAHLFGMAGGMSPAILGTAMGVPAPIAFGVTSALQSLVPAYHRALDAGLTEEEAASRAWKVAGLDGAVGTVLGFIPGGVAEGATFKQAILKGLRNMGVIAPAAMVAGEKAKAVVEDREYGLPEAAETAAQGAAMGLAMSAPHFLAAGRGKAKGKDDNEGDTGRTGADDHPLPPFDKPPDEYVGKGYEAEHPETGKKTWFQQVGPNDYATDDGRYWTRTPDPERAGEKPNDERTPPGADGERTPPPPPPGDEQAGEGGVGRGTPEEREAFRNRVRDEALAREKAKREQSASEAARRNSEHTPQQRRRTKLEELAASYSEHSPEDIAKWDDEALKDYVNVKRNYGSYTKPDDMLRKAGVPDDEIKNMPPDKKAAMVDELHNAVSNALDDEIRNINAKEGTRAAPVELKTAEDVAKAASAAATEYSPEQGEANNRTLGHAKWNGLAASLEVNAGGVRKGTNPETGERWATSHTVPYGYWKGTKGADGMHVDVHFGPHIDDTSLPAYVIDEMDPKTGKFRQHKTFVGFANEQDAVRAYLGTSTKTPEMIGGVTAMPADEFKTWVHDESKTTKQLSKAGARAADNKVSNEAGTQSGGMAADAPSAEPVSDLLAQVRDLNDSKHPRAAVWLPASSVAHVAKAGLSHQILRGRHGIEDFDGKGGLLITRDQETAQQAVADLHAGVPVQTIVGRLVGAGAGKPADATHVVQQLDKAGNVTRESGVRQADIAKTTKEFAAPGRSVRVVPIAEAIKRRAGLIEKESGKSESILPDEPVEPTHEHHAAIERMLVEAGIDASEVRPADVAHAAHLHAQGLAPREAFIAAVKDALTSGAINQAAAEQEFGHGPIEAILETGDGAGRGKPSAQTASAGTGRRHSEAAQGGTAEKPSGVAGSNDSTPVAEADGRERQGTGAVHPEEGRGSAAGNRQGETAKPAEDLIGERVENISEHKVTDAAGTTITVVPVVVEAKDLITSSDQGYDGKLQPRDRDRAASQAQIREIATRLNPERLGYSAEADRGAPIVGPDRMVESGNGRIAALRKLYETRGPNATKYREWLKSQGVDVSKFKEPVLVRQRTTKLDEAERVAFTRAANQSATLSMSAPERALADAEYITPQMLGLIQDAGNLGAAANRPFIRAFVAAIPSSERGAIADAQGHLSAEGATRARNAVLAKAYGDADVLSRITESTDDDVKSISNALVIAAPDWAKLRADIDAGKIRAEADLTPDLLKAVKITADLRGKGVKLAEYMDQQDAFDTLPEPVEVFLRIFYDVHGKRASGASFIASALGDLADQLGKLTSGPSLDLGGPEVKANDVQRATFAKARRLQAPVSEGNSGRGAEASRPEGEKPRNDAARAGDRGRSEGGVERDAEPRLEGLADNPDDLFSPRTEPGAEGKPQLVIPGAERVSGAALAKRRAAEPLKPKVAQKPVQGGLFGDEIDQTDLVDAVRRDFLGATRAIVKRTPVTGEYRVDIGAVSRDATAKLSDLETALKPAKPEVVATPAPEAEGLSDNTPHFTPAWDQSHYVDAVENMPDPRLSDYYVKTAGGNAHTSRTATLGTVDLSSSKDKAAAMGSAVNAKETSRANLATVIGDLYANRFNIPNDAQGMGEFVRDVAVQINKGLVAPENVERTFEITKYPATAAADLPIAYQQFSNELARRLEVGAPIETAAWIEWRANISDHFWSDGAGRTSKALAALALMRHNLPLPAYPSNKEFYSYAPKTQVDPRFGGEAYLGEAWQRFRDFYTNLVHKAEGAELKPGTPAQRAEIRGMLADGTPIEVITQHPLVQSVLREMREMPPTVSGIKQYNDPEWRASRVYNFDGELVFGTDNAVKRMIAQAESYSKDGPVRDGRHAVLVVGAPASGKSTASDPIARELFAAIPDPDDSKKIIIEFRGGTGTQGVHEESSLMAKEVLAHFMSRGENLVVPTVGSDPAGVRARIENFLENGYTVDLVHVSATPEISQQRNIERWLETGRLVDPAYLTQVGDKPRQTYYILGREGHVKDTADLDTSGLRANRVEGTGPIADLLRNGSHDRAPLSRSGTRGAGSAEGQGSERPGLADSEPASTTAPQRVPNSFQGLSDNEPGFTPRQTDTPEFKRWFGDSKVVNPDGSPKVVFHGTEAEFDTFERTEDIGFHFGPSDTASKRILSANGYGVVRGESAKNAYRSAERDGRVVRGANVMPVYLKIEKPLRVEDLGDWQPVSVLNELKRRKVISGAEYETARFEPGHRLIDRDYVRDALAAKGYDGMVYRNKTEGIGNSYIVFDPAQIKSATGNSGAFDPNNPSILADNEPAFALFDNQAGRAAAAIDPGPSQENAPLARDIQRHVISEGIATGQELLVAVDERGELLDHTFGKAGFVTIDKGLQAKLADPNNSIVIHHNHPSNTGLSNIDLGWLALPGLHGVWAHGHGGNVARAGMTPAGRRAFANMPPQAARARLYKAVSDLSWGFHNALQMAIKDGAITMEEGQVAYSHLVSTALDRAGLIDYRSNADLGDLVEKLKLEPLIAAAARTARSLLNDQGTGEGLRGRANPFSHLGDVGATFELPQGTPEGRADAASDDRDRGAFDSQEEAGEVGEGLAEDTNRFKPRPGAAAGGAGGNTPPPRGTAAPGAAAPQPPAGRRPITGALTQARTIQAFKNFWTSNFQPELFSDRALEADPLFARYKSASAQEKDAVIKQSESEWEYWNKRPDTERIRFLDDLETAGFGNVPPDPKQAGMAKRYRRMLDENWKLEKQFGSQAAFVDDYFPHIWEKPDDWRSFSEAKSAQVGPTWFQKKRTIDYITDGLAAGLKLKYTNPVDIVVHRLMSGVDMRQRMQLLYDLKKMGMAWEGEQGGEKLVQRGWRAINAPDRKQWVLAPDVQTLWKNAVEAKGLWQAEHVGGSMFRGWMALKNAWVPIKLALSAFHPLHVLHINYSDGMARAWNDVTRGHDPMAALRSLGQGFLGPMQAAPGASVGAVAGGVIGSMTPVGPYFGAIAGTVAGSLAFKAAKRMGAPDLPHIGKEAREAWATRPSKMTPQQKAMVTLMNEGGFVPQLSEQLKIAAKRGLHEAWQKLLRREAGVPEWRRMISATMRRPIEALQKPIFEDWIPNIKAAAYLHEAAALLKRRPELLQDDVGRRQALRAIGQQVDSRFGEKFYGAMFWNRTLKDVAIGSFLSLGWNYGFVQQFGGAAMETISRPLGLAPAFRPNQGRKNIRSATNKIPFALAYIGSAMIITALMTLAYTGELPDDPLDYIFARIGGKNPDGTPRRITNMFYLREVPMLLKHVQERGGNWLTGSYEMVTNKLMFEPFKELLNNRTYYGYNIWDENASVYKQIWQGLKHVFGDQASPMTISGATRAAELSSTPFPSFKEFLQDPSKLGRAIGAKGVGESMAGFGPAPSYVEKSALENRIAYLYGQHVSPYSRTEEEGETSKEKMAVRTAIGMARQNEDEEALERAMERGRAIGLKPEYMNKIGRGPTALYLFSRLPNADQKALLESASPAEYQTYFPKAHQAVKTELNNKREATSP